MISENQTHINMFIFTLMQSNTNQTNNTLAFASLTNGTHLSNSVFWLWEINIFVKLQELWMQKTPLNLKEY